MADSRANDAARRSQPSVLAVSVHFRTPELQVRCLASLERARDEVPGLRALVVDNASGAGAAAYIAAAIEERAWGGWAELIESPHNRGFAAGNNLALAHAGAAAAPADYFLLLNPDAELEPGALGELVAFLEARPDVGFAGPRTEIGLGQHRNTAFRFPGILSSLDDGLHFGPLSRVLRRFVVSPAPRMEPHATDWLSGGCLLVRRRVFDQVGPMDEGYFLYYEETDFMLAASRLGWDAWYVPSSRILHDAGASTGCTGGRELERRVPVYWFDSRRRFFRKNRGRVVAFLADLAWLSGNLLFQLRRLVTRAPRLEPPYFLWDFVRYNFLGRRWGCVQQDASAVPGPALRDAA